MRCMRPFHDRRKELGLTLGELLVVSAVFSILAIMFFFSSSHAIIKTKLSRALQEEKIIANALRSYEVDNYDIPTEEQGLGKLESGPLKYLTQLPLDPFTLGSSSPKSYVYVCDVTTMERCMIVSVGPDGDLDIDKVVGDLKRKSEGSMHLSAATWPFRKVLMTPEEIKAFVAQYSYDPTNGSMSNGDIITLYGE